MENAQIIPADLEKLIDERVEKKVAERIGELELRLKAQLKELKEKSGGVSDRATIVVFSGDMDKLLAAFIIATGAASMALDVSMYFTFWGLAALKKKTVFRGKPIEDKMVAAMFPSGPNSVGTSKMNMMGMGPVFFKHIMKKKKIESLPDLIQMARELDVKMIGCSMAMDVLGLTKEELIDGLEFGGVATYLGDASDSKITLFI